MTFQPPVLFDPVVGNIGLLPDGALVLLHLTEPDGVLPADAMDNLQNLGPDLSHTTAPASVSCWSGPGRRFVASSSTALLAQDIAGDDTLLIREVTVQAIIALTLVNTTAQTIIQRGIHDGTAGEPISYGLAVQQEAAHAGLIDIFWYWEDSAGTIHAEAAGTYQHPGDGQFILLTATRRWESTGSVVLRYYVADQLLAEVVSTDGDIAGGTTGTTTLGGKKSAGAWSQFFNGTIDELKVTSYEMSADEVRETWRRLFVHQPAGVDMFAGLAPPGAPWFKDPGNRIGRRVKLAGQALGLSIAKIEAMRAMWLPDGAAIDTIARWERVCGLAPRPRDSLDVRRARVVSYLSRTQGFSIPALQQAFSGPFDLAASDVQILEFPNLITDDFSTLEAERWFVGSAGSGSWSIASGELKIVANNGDDIRWDPSRAMVHVRTPLANVNPKNAQPFVAQIKLSTYWANLPANTIVGLFLYNRRTNDSLWFGVKTVAGVRKLGYQTFNSGVLEAFVPLVNPSLDQAYWLRIATPLGPTVGDGGGSFVFGWSTTGPTSGFTTQTISAGLPFGFAGNIEWAGAAAMSTDAALASGLQATFDDFVLLPYNGDRPFHWYAYRDPGLAGDADLIGGELLALKVKPGQTYAAAIESKSLLCDDPTNGLCDRGCMGGV